MIHLYKMTLKAIVIFSTLLLIVAFSPDVLAQTTPQTSFVDFAGCTGPDCSACNVVNIANGMIKWIIGMTFLLFGALLAIAGVRLVTSGGNPSALSDAKDKFTNAIIGFLIILSAWLIIDTIMKALVGSSEGGEDGQIAITTGGTSTGWLFWHEVECFEQFTPTQPDSVDMIELPDSSDDGPISGDAPIDTEIPTQPAGKICYPGDGSGQVCFDAVTGIAGQSNYQYPSGYGMTPPSWVDSHNPGPGVTMNTKISRNYTLRQLNVSGTCGHGGRYVYISPGALMRLEGVNSRIGTRLSINSAHRSPGCNAAVKGASHSVHMSGAAFDIQPPGGDRCAVVRACRAEGANFIMTYTSTGHVHCDWRGGGRSEKLTISC